LAFAQRYVDMKWPRSAAKPGGTPTDASATITAALVDDRPDRPDTRVVRTALRRHLLPSAARTATPLGNILGGTAGVTPHLDVLTRSRRVRPV
jgi:hypothetical protein